MRGEVVPDDRILSVLLQRLADPDVKERGWVMDGYPSNGSQAAAPPAAGVLPAVVIHLSIGDVEVFRRIGGVDGIRSRELAVAGTIIMSTTLQEALDAIDDARVPPAWTAASWPASNLGLWFAAVLQRFEHPTGPRTSGPWWSDD